MEMLRGSSKIASGVVVTVVLREVPSLMELDDVVWLCFKCFKLGTRWL